MSKESKVLVVTGASQGLGEGFVKAYRDRGWRVVGNSRSVKPSNDPDYITVSGDIGEPAIAKKVVQTAVDELLATKRIEREADLRLYAAEAKVLQ